MKATDLDKLFDEGKEDITPYLDLTRVRRPNQPQQRLTVDLPTPLVRSLDQMADCQGITTPALIESLLSESLKAQPAKPEKS